MQLKSKRQTYIFYTVVLGALIVCIFFSVCVGRYTITFSNIMEEQSLRVLWNIRIPRILMAVLCGGSLGIAGGIFQKIFKNDLASPDIIGVSSGESMGAVAAILLFGNMNFMVQGCSFLGGMLAVLLVFFIAHFDANSYLFSLIISGVVISSLCSSLIMFLKYVADPYDTLPSIEFWLMGGLQNVKPIQIFITAFVCATLIAFLWKLNWKLKLLSLGDDEIRAMGINLFALRIGMLSLATLLVSIIVANCGVISWVGLIAPYIARLLSRHWMALSFIIGSWIVLMGDTVARTVATSEIPLGVLISFVGAPFLIYLLIKNGGSQNA